MPFQESRPGDPVTREILAYAFKALVDEMAIIEYRSSFSPVIRESLDYDCALFDPAGELIAAAEINPALLGATQFALQAVLPKHDGLKPGDVLITNHPYLAGSHTPDLMLFSPVFVGDRLIGYVNSIAHHVDVGGRFPGSESVLNEEVFQEGLLFPGVHLVEEGRRVKPLYELIRANVRDPDATLGDLDAQLAACRRGVELLTGLCERYGVEVVLDAMTALIERTAKLAAEQFASWPDRTIEVEGWMDDAGPGTESVRISAAVGVRDGVLEIDLDGTGPESPWGINVPLGSLKSTALFIARNATGLPANGGLARQVSIEAPEGSILNPRFPAPIGARHMPIQRLAAVLVEAIGQLLPEKAIAGCCISCDVHYLQAVDDQGKLTIFCDYYGGGAGATRENAGDSAVDTYTANCQMQPVEIIELEYPWRVERSELVDGSGGAGRMSGGLGLRRDYQLLAEHADGSVYADQTKPDNAPAGIEGGSPGLPGHIAVRRHGDEDWETIPPKGSVAMKKGDSISLVTAGGGGFGASEDS